MKIHPPLGCVQIQINIGDIYSVDKEDVVQVTFPCVQEAGDESC